MLACKRFLGVPLKAPNKAVYGELGRFPLVVNSQLRCIKYWFKLLQMSNERLPKQAYLMLVTLDKNGKRCLDTKVRELSSKTEFFFVWLIQGVQHLRLFIKELRQRLVDIFVQEWTGAIRGKERYCLYKLSCVTSRFELSTYQQNIDIYSHVSLYRPRPFPTTQAVKASLPK